MSDCGSLDVYVGESTYVATILEVSQMIIGFGVMEDGRYLCWVCEFFQVWK